MKDKLNAGSPGDVAICLENVSKVFKSKVRIRKGDRRQRLRLVLSLCGVELAEGRNDADVEALCNASGVIHKGVVTGIAGHSGCGKSTLLKVISKVTRINSGEIRVHGKLARLLDVDDLNQNLTGNDVLADEATGKKIWRAGKRQSLLEFAGLTEFAEVPVRKYSTGMRLRLAMAAVLNQDADIVLIDDYSAVGDLEFQQKCRDKIRELVAQGVAVVIASNDAKLLEQLCDKVVWMEEGTIQEIGEAREILSRIRSEVKQKIKVDFSTLKAPVDQLVTRLVHATVRDNDTNADTDFTTDSDLRFRMIVEGKKDIQRLRLAITLFNRKKQVLRTVLRDNVPLKKGEFLDAEAVLPSSILAPGFHTVELIVEPEWGGDRDTIKVSAALGFNVTSTEKSGAVFRFSEARDNVIAAPDLKWTCTAG